MTIFSKLTASSGQVYLEAGDERHIARRAQELKATRVDVSYADWCVARDAMRNAAFQVPISPPQYVVDRQGAYPNSGDQWDAFYKSAIWSQPPFSTLPVDDPLVIMRNNALQVKTTIPKPPQ